SLRFWGHTFWPAKKPRICQRQVATARVWFVIARGFGGGSDMSARYVPLWLCMLCAFLAVQFDFALAQNAEPVQLTPGFTKLIRFDRPIATVVIGNPEVADARAQTDRSIALVGKAVGITNLIALDNTGAEVFSSLVVVGARDAGKVIVNARRQLH